MKKGQGADECRERQDTGQGLSWGNFLHSRSHGMGAAAGWVEVMALQLFGPQLGRVKSSDSRRDSLDEGMWPWVVGSQGH